MIVGAVIHSGTSNGILEVRVTPGSNIGNDELVELGTLADGDTLIWNAAAGRFENDAAITGLQTALDGKQASLVSGTNIKTVNGNTLLGSGDLVISGGGGGALNDLSDVAITTPTEGDVLYYDGATWINDASVASSLVTINTALAPLARQTTTTEVKAISVGTTAPTTPSTGDLWVDTN